MNSPGKIRSSDFSANDFPGKEGHTLALCIRPNFPGQIYPNFLDPFPGNVRTIRGYFENFEIFG